MFSLELLLCRTIGCCSIFARWFAWPHRYICSPMAERGLRKYGFYSKDIDAWVEKTSGDIEKYGPEIRRAMKDPKEKE